MKISTMKLILSVLTIAPGAAMATCGWANGAHQGTVNFKLNSLIVQRDAPVGTVLATAKILRSDIASAVGVSSAATRMLDCSNETQTMGNSSYSIGSYAGGNILNTGIDGVGIKITFTNMSSLIPGLSFPPQYNMGLFGAITPNVIGDVTISLIKTANVTGSGTIPAGFLMHYSVPSVGNVVNYALASSTVSTAACSVTQSLIPVSMGQVLKTHFNGVGSHSDEVGFKISLNCDAGSKVNITLEGTEDGSGTSGVIALIPPASGISAGGVGLQVLYAGVPVNLGSAISAGTASSAGSMEIPFTARYYQTTGTVTAGTANATATFTMTYN
ncbi:fimbrial protein [Enterobacter mori]|uniref:fimbrial protein n=1 Tax=Enterobacter mori TaxID=539813 RepID=UPI001B8C0414|nr:fimbrial protein [Enterobacter mori]MBS3046384.1 fimbrial protein [Enterobacter mori]